MTRKDTIKLLMAIQSAYPNFKPQDKTVAVDTWYMFLEEYQPKIVEMAFKSYVVTDKSGFAPSVGQLIDKIYMISSPEELNDMAAWALVSKALRNGMNNAAEEFEKLPEAVREAVGSPTNLRNWAFSDNKAIETVIQSNFKNTYNTVVARRREVEKLPKDVKIFIDSINQKIGRIVMEDNNSGVAGIDIKNDYITGEKECIPMPEHIKSKWSIE